MRNSSLENLQIVLHHPVPFWQEWTYPPQKGYHNFGIHPEGSLHAELHKGNFYRK